MYEHLDQSTTQWSILLTNPVISDLIYKNIIQIIYVCKARGKFVVREGTKVCWGGHQNIMDRGDMPWLGGGGYPLMGMVPQTTHPHPPDIGQPWSNSLLDIQGFGQVGGWSSEFQTMSYCAVLSTATNQWRRRWGGGHNWKIFLFTFYMFLSI